MSPTGVKKIKQRMGRIILWSISHAKHNGNYPTNTTLWVTPEIPSIVIKFSTLERVNHRNVLRIRFKIKRDYSLRSLNFFVPLSLLVSTSTNSSLNVEMVQKFFLSEFDSAAFPGLTLMAVEKPA